MMTLGPRSALQAWLSEEPSLLVCELAELGDCDASAVAA
jgi:hypothetical protein